MALKPIEILKDLIEGTAHTITIDSVVSLGGGSYKLLTENTLYLRTKKKVTIDGTEYEITDFSLNEFITVSATSGADVPVTVSSFDADSPLFVWGNPQMVSAELVKRQKNGTITWPYIWALELSRTSRNLDPAVAVKTTKSFVLFFLDSNDKQNWTIESHYNNGVYTQGNYVSFFESILKARRDLFDTDSISYTQDDLVNFGDYIVDKGMEERILNDDVTGVGIQIDIPFIINECSTTVITSRCVDASETFNGSSVSPIPSGGTKDIVVQNDAGTPVQVGTVLTDTPTDLIIEVPAGGSVSKNVYYQRPYLTQSTSYRDYDEAWRISDGDNDYNDNRPALSLVQEVLPDIPNGRYDYLKYVNSHGHKFRFTGENGGYYDENDGNYYDVNGVLSDKATEYPDLGGASWWIYDHLTGYRMPNKRGGAINWNNHLDGTQTYSFGGSVHNWFVPTKEEAELMNNNSNEASAMLSTTPNRPFFSMSLTSIWTGTTSAANTSQAIGYNYATLAGVINVFTKTTSSAVQHYFEVFDNSYVTQP